VELSKVQLVYAFGLIGVIYSPVHLCLVLSTEYFKADLAKVLRRFHLPSACIAAVSIAIYVLG
jgi:hypothetical protein